MFVKVFPDCSHGWTLRYDINNSTAVTRANEAYQDMLEWLLKYVK
ncbi:hypothetical protein ERO13_A02G028101v2 [Gossypium hirsutum]|nr:hypothetical protein ERO13_A02G028101v2 [Gossypium hirsutum]